MTTIYNVTSTTAADETQVSSAPAAAQTQDTGQLAIVAAVHQQLAATATQAATSSGLGASANDPNDPSTWNWPWVANPDGSYSIPDFNINPGDSLDVMLAKLEQAQSFLQNNPDSANGFIAYLKDLATVGQNYQHLTPGQQGEFNLAIIDLNNQTSGTGSLGYELMNLVMYGTLFNNGIKGEGDTITFLGNLMGLFSGLASKDSLFQSLSTAVQGIYSDIVVTDASGNLVINPKYIGTETDTATGQTYTFLKESDSSVQTDYQHYMLGELNRMGSFFMNANVQTSQNLLYGTIANDIMSTAKNSWEAMTMLLALLLNGPDNDITRQINGVGHTLDLGTGLANQLHQLMSFMQTGDFTQAANVTKLMTMFNGLAKQVGSIPQLSGFAPQFLSTLNNIIGASGTVAANASWSVSNGTYQIPAGAEFSITENGVTKNYDNTGSTSAMTIYVSGNGTMKNITPTSKTDPTVIPITVSLQEMAYSDTVNGMPVNGLGDFADAGAIIKGMSSQDTATALTGLVTLTQSPNSTLQNEISTDTNTKTTLEGMVKEGFAVITNTDDTILKGLQNANN